MTTIQTTPEFDKDVKKLRRKYDSLEADLLLFYKALTVIRKAEIRGTVRVSNLGARYDKFHIFKVRSFHCKSLRGRGSNSGIRVIYYDDVDNDSIILIQIYHKSTDENHDADRITGYLDNLIREY